MSIQLNTTQPVALLHQEGNDFYTLRVKEYLSHFELQVLHMDTTPVLWAHLGDGADMFSDENDEPLWPNTHRFNQACRVWVESLARNQGELSELIGQDVPALWGEPCLI